MFSYLEARIRSLEALVANALRQLAAVTQTAKSLAQDANQGGGQGGGGGSSGGTFIGYTTSGITARSGTLPGTGDIKRVFADPKNSYNLTYTGEPDLLHTSTAYGIVNISGGAIPASVYIAYVWQPQSQAWLVTQGECTGGSTAPLAAPTSSTSTGLTPAATPAPPPSP